MDAIDAGLLVLGLGGLDDLVEGGEEAKSAEPPHETLGGIDVLAVKVEAQLGRHAIVPDGVDVLDELFSRSCVRMVWVGLGERSCKLNKNGEEKYRKWYTYFSYQRTTGTRAGRVGPTR